MNKSKISAAIVLTASLWGFNAQAAGYQLNEYSVTGLGRSFAGPVSSAMIIRRWLIIPRV